MCVMWDERACSAKCEGAGNYRGAVLFFKGRERIAVGVRGRGCGLGSPLLLPLGSVMIMTTIMTNEYISINMFCRLDLVCVCVCW